MILFYAANGMSEALYLFTLVATTRYLLRWLHEDDLRSLAYAAVALGACYLARIEAVGPAILAGAVVLAAGIRRSVGTRKERYSAGLLDATIFLAPFVLCFVGWAVASLAITGQAFGELSSQYGTAQISAAGYHKTALVPGLAFEGHVLEYLAPLLPVLLLVALVVAIVRRDVGVAAVISVCGGALVFDMVTYLNGGIISSYRYFIATIPLEALLAGSIVAALAPRSSGDASLLEPRTSPAIAARPRPIRRRAMVTTAVGAVVSIALLAPSIPATAAGMFNPKVGVEESNWLGFVIHGLEGHKLTAAELVNQRAHAYELHLGQYITNMHLPRGDVIVDNFDECITPMLTSVADPRVFVIPNDRAYKETLDAPLVFHAHYLLVAPAPTSLRSRARSTRRIRTSIATVPASPGSSTNTLRWASTAPPTGSTASFAIPPPSA